MQRPSPFCEVRNEPPVIGSQSNEGMDFLRVRRCGPITDFLYFFGVGRHPIFGKDMTKEIFLGLEEVRLFWFDF